MDLKKYRSKLIGNESERAVSPVIGVILMVAITVILAAVIAAFVLDLGSSAGGAPVNAVVDSEVDNSSDPGIVTLRVREMGNAEKFELRGDGVSELDDDDVSSLNATGESIELDYGTPGGDTSEISVVAIDGEDESVVETVEINHD
ncbi:type IV pilin [Natronosalvus rutilus]|uniref:Type IV pilin N-terminal domain-containing protein n=1 Tax=Natronosalvus rutilus TaxID=2953753 RepID=A0A9E7SVA3_9EURY|nr:type IV pilin N-terminal domain-containing protein [Natronosalvus rutilus]UTF52811.1 type IV pilin N-terminal domain-containing protein [Natronosalvus rutilus]